MNSIKYALKVWAESYKFVFKIICPGVHHLFIIDYYFSVFMTNREKLNPQIIFE
jgi:hypothetical protein